MQRQKATFHIAPGQYEILKHKMLNWANRFSILLFLDSNNYADKYSRYACLLGAGSEADCYNLEAMQQWHSTNKDWLFGHISYDYKNSLENKLSSKHTIKKGNKEFHFFRPQVVAHVNTAKTALTIETLNVDPAIIFEAINNTTPVADTALPQITFQQTIDKDTYLAAITQLRKHIADGDCYEINYCNEGYAEHADIEPLQVFNALNKISSAPFAAYYRNEDAYMMCASPERYLYKQDATVLSQPIKGTARRDADAVKDEEIKQSLYNSIKDRAENVMIVDLVRNDLARSCITGSINVDELFGIHSFPQVHQMISTVSGQLKSDAAFTDAIRYSFPMGSMTGAPKIKVMQLIEEYEYTRRELFAGTVGYITPEGNFDLNVIIRSLFYNAAAQYLSYQTGGAITYDSTPEQEWEEMRLKAWALERIFS